MYVYVYIYIYVYIYTHIYIYKYVYASHLSMPPTCGRYSNEIVASTWFRV